MGWNKAGGKHIELELPRGGNRLEKKPGWRRHSEEKELGGKEFGGGGGPKGEGVKGPEEMTEGEKT